MHKRGRRDEAKTKKRRKTQNATSAPEAKSPRRSMGDLKRQNATKSNGLYHPIQLSTVRDASEPRYQKLSRSLSCGRVTCVGCCATPIRSGPRFAQPPSRLERALPKRTPKNCSSLACLATVICSDKTREEREERVILITNLNGNQARRLDEITHDKMAVVIRRPKMRGCDAGEAFDEG